MIEIETHSHDLTPWHEVQRLFSRMQSFRVQIGKETYHGPMALELDDSRNLTIKLEALTPAKAKSKKPPPPPPPPNKPGELGSALGRQRGRPKRKR